MEQDILETNFSEILSVGNRILLFWDAHGKELADYVLGEIMRLLQNKNHIVLVHDIVDARYCEIDPVYIRPDGLPQIWLGDLVSPFEELFPLYDFLSRNRIAFASPFQSLKQWVLQNDQKYTELQHCWGTNFPSPTSLEASGWIYFDLNESRGVGLRKDLAFPEFHRRMQETPASAPNVSTSTPAAREDTDEAGMHWIKKTAKMILPPLIWNLLRLLKPIEVLKRG